MDPGTAVSEAYKIGGIAAVLLLILVYGGWLMFKFFVGMVKDLGARLDMVQGAQAKELTEVVRANTASNTAVTTACAEIRHVNAQLIDALHLRPCLFDQVPEREPDSRKPLKTPLPQKYPHK